MWWQLNVNMMYVPWCFTHTLRQQSHLFCSSLLRQSLVNSRLKVIKIYLVALWCAGIHSRSLHISFCQGFFFSSFPSSSNISYYMFREAASTTQGLSACWITLTWVGWTENVIFFSPVWCGAALYKLSSQRRFPTLYEAGTDQAKELRRRSSQSLLCGVMKY